MGRKTYIQIRLFHINCIVCGNEFEARCENLDIIKCIYCKTRYRVNLTLEKLEDY